MTAKRTQLSEFGIELMPCPFCGKRYRGLSISNQRISTRFECPQCGATGPFPSRNMPQTDEKECTQATITAWNRRKS